MRRIATFAALAVPGLFAVGIAASAATAADGCSNAAVRAQQNATHLPNCMAYERVTPQDKNGASPSAEAITADGDRVLFGMNSATADPLSFLNGKYRATRTADGWTTAALMPSFNLRLPKGTEIPSHEAWSADLERVVINTYYPLNENDRGLQANGLGSRDLYLREADGSFSWLVPDPSVVDNNTSLEVQLMRGSTDLERIVVTTQRQFDPRVENTDVSHIYVRTSSGMHLASILPDGSLPTDLPLTPPNFQDQARRVSADGRRIAFTVGTGESARIYVRYNADDPATAVTREVAVSPDGDTCTEASLVGLSDDGTKLLFSCGTALLPGAPDLGLYVRDLDGGPAAVRSVGTTGGRPTVIGGSPDYSRVYLRGGGARGYMVRAGGSLELVASPLSGDAPLNDAYVSPNGEYLAFDSDNGYGFDRGESNSFQVYRYAASTGEIECVSCRPAGTPTTGDARLNLAIPNALSPPEKTNAVTSVGTVAFSTATDLDSRDTNGVYDAYAWIDGRQVLLSDGRNREPSTSMGGTPDGRSFLVATAASLVPEDVDGNAYDVYLARSGGGYLAPDAPAPCTASCQGPAAERPGAPGIGSADFVGRGNLLEQTKDPAKRATVSLTAAKSKGPRVTVRVKVSGAGSIRVSGNGLRQATAKAKKAGTYSVTVRLSSHGLAQQRKRGRLTTRTTARFTPVAGASVQARRSLTVAATTKKGGR